MTRFVVFLKFLRSYAETDIKIEFYTKNYVYRFIFSPVRPNYSLSRSRLAVRVRPLPSESVRVSAKRRKICIRGMLHILCGMLIRKGNFVLHFVTEACYSYMHDTKINNFVIIIYKLLEHVGNCNQMVKDSCRFACVSWWHFCTSFRRDTCSDLGHMQTLIYIFSTTQTTMKTGKIKITVSPDIAAETQASTTQTTMKTGNIKITVSPNIAAETQASQHWVLTSFSCSCRAPAISEQCWPSSWTCRS